MNNASLFFSLIVPAHNEALYIEETLRHMQALDYPKERCEIIVVENGSTDATYEIAKRFENANLRVLQSAKGVSRAKNLGIDSARKESDWLIFVDADTILTQEFLRELDSFLRGARANFTVGTFTILPSPDSLRARLWFRFYDFGHWLTKTSYSIKAVRRDLFPPVRFDEALAAGEDLHVIGQARAFGKFFFMRTKSVYTSTRRFEKVGWWKILFLWTFVAVLPERLQKNFGYDVVR